MPKSRDGWTDRTSSFTLDPGISGPYGRPVSGCLVTLETVPYGEPITFAQKMKNLVGSNARSNPNSGPHLKAAAQPQPWISRWRVGTDQSSTSALPVSAWQMTKQLSRRALSLPHVL